MADINKQYLVMSKLATQAGEHYLDTLHYWKGTYRGKLVVELGQHGVIIEDGRVPLQSLQLLQKTLLVLLAAVPGAHRLEQGLARSITPLQDHHLRKNGKQSNIKKREQDFFENKLK